MFALCNYITCRFKRVKVEHQQVDVSDLVLPALLFVKRVAAHSQQSSVNLWVQSLHSSVQYLR